MFFNDNVPFLIKNKDITLNTKSDEVNKIITQEIISFDKSIYFTKKNYQIGMLSNLAFKAGDWLFDKSHIKDNIYSLSNSNIGVSFLAELKGSTYHIRGDIKRLSDNKTSFFDNVKINGKGESNKSLRPAQIGAIYALLSHWSLSSETCTVVLPTGTGKTETMLLASLADKATHTLVIVPSIDLKYQIADKFSSWGILRELGVIPNPTPNPTVLMLKEGLAFSEESIGLLHESDVVITTPALIARASPTLQKTISDIFTHVYFDEAHHIQASEWDIIKKLFSKSKIVQFTATPYRNDKKPIEGKIVYNYPLSHALKDNCFSRISLVAVDERHPRKKDLAIANAAMSRLITDRKNGWIRHKMMVRADNKKHAIELFDMYKELFPNERIAIVYTGIKNRRNLISDIKNGAYDIIVCVDMLKEGFDYPDFKIAAVHGIHKSLAVLLQFIGRFTRTQEGLGDASFVVNYADEKISIELENLFQEGSGWEEVISEIADAKKNEAETLLSFLQGCKPFSGFDSPNIDLNPKLVYPALSTVCFKCKKAEWKNFKNAFNLNKYSLSQPFINKEENVFYFTTQKREKVKWARTDKMRDQTWDLIVMHYNISMNLLYIGYSEKKLDINFLVEKITEDKPTQLRGDCVFRSFDNIKRLSIIHAGIFKPANHLHRYSRLSGADVTTELTKWKEGQRCQKSDFVGIGFRDGFPVSVGASVKGKIWSPARVGDLKEWKSWCLEIGNLITDESIDANKLLEDSAQKTQLLSYPENIIILATDWSEDLYERMHKITIERPQKESILLAECALKNISHNNNHAFFEIIISDEKIPFSIVLGGERGHSIEGLDETDIYIEGLKSNTLSLKQFFEENPPTMFLLDGCTISGCIHTNYGESFEVQIPSERITTLEWDDVNYTVESLYKGDKIRNNSIQEYMMIHLKKNGARIIFNDDNAGESSDIVAIFVEDDLIRFEMIHCKYSKETSGARLSDLYEVCGQAVVSLRYKWKPEELLKHMERRNGMGILKNKRFYHGSPDDLENIRKALKYSNVEFEFSIAQPGVEKSKLSIDMRNFLGSIYSTIIEMTETKLKCYFNR
ncbi:putative helicase [Edwardsiella piscicida]|uniref:Helicase n=1 Tax=Edwardsiella piscicida TaxID=1263550 RepID=A0AAU8P0F9_EDWPI|nr:putative helicase [Edwardsiella tarda EIB202]QHR95737.1 DEAD/DEAH box helicase family protein [Edwardsiella piscicida]